MNARGHVQNGVVVLEPGVRFAEGQPVIVTPSKANDASASASSAIRHSVLDIPPVSLGALLRDPSSDDDVLNEMLADRS